MRHTSRLKTLTWYSVVTLLVTVAVLVSVLRLAIATVSEYRQHLEDMAGNYLGKPVAIAKIDARLVGFKPTVVLDDISLLDEVSLEPLAHFSSVMIALNPISSLRELRPVIDLSVHGANIVIALREDGTIQVQGVSLSQNAASGGNSGALGAWLLGQSHLALKDSTLVWRDMATGDEAVFAGVNLELQNLPTRHRLNGYVRLPKELGKELRVALDIQGDLLTQKDWVGELYLKAVRVQPAPWLQEFDYKGLQLQQGSVDVDIWSRWQGGLLEGVEGSFDLAGLKFAGTEDARLLQRIAGQLRYEANEDGWMLQLQRLQLEHEDLADESLMLQLEKNDAGTVFQASALPLELLQRYAPYIPQLQKAQRDWLLQAAPAGRVSEVRVELAQEGAIRAVAEVEGLRISPWKRLPGISGLNGHFAMDGSAAQMLIDSTELELEMPLLFRRPLALHRASGVVQMQRQGEQWRVLADSVQVANPDIQADIDFDSWIAQGEAPLVSLSARVREGRAKAVPGYLPAHIMSAGSVDWLDKAFVDGHIATGRILLHGRLSSFPFRQQQGRFEVQLDAENVTLHYQDGWPDLAHVNGEVRFDGPGMVIAARRAAIYSGKLGMTRVGINDFKQPVLQVEGTGNAPLPDMMRFLQSSPLAEHMGGAFERIETRGDGSINLSLAIPLSKAVARQYPLKVSGQVGFHGGDIKVAEGVVFTGVTGDLHFTEKSFEAKAIQGELYDAPTQVSVFTKEESRERSKIVVTAQGQASSSALQRELGLPILERLDGNTDWQARFTIQRGGAGGGELVVQSTMQGMAFDLPQPAAKTADEVKPLAVTLQLGGEAKRPHRFAYGDFVSVSWQHESDPFQLRGASVSFGGNKETVLSELGVIRIGGSLDNFALTEWLALRKEIGAQDSKGPPLPIELDMQRLHLVSSVGEKTESVLRVADIPQITILVSDFAYGDFSLGNVMSKIRPDGKRLMIDTVKVTAPSFAAVMSGQWEEGDNSRFDLNLSSGNFGRMMHDLGFASVISGGKVSAKGEFFWPGNPATFSVEKLGGEVHVKIENGSIEDVNPGAGKLLGLLSLQALPKRLFLDFSDLSEKGLQFTEITGDFRFEDGDAFTQNLYLESLPANILITGRTGLVNQDFDQLIAVIPNVSDTVSVAGALAWGPQVAAVLIVLQKLFESDIDAATMTRYKLNGSWDEPKLTRLDPVESYKAGDGL